MLNSTTYGGPKERWAGGKCISRGKTETPLIAPLYGGRPSPFHATFTVLFYFEGYIYIYFQILLLVSRREIRSSPPRGFIKILYRPRIYERDVCKMETARWIFLIDMDGWMEGMSRLFFLIVGGLLSSFSEQSEYFFGYFFWTGVRDNDWNF